MLLPSLSKIKSLAAGNNHILALDFKGSLLAWGSGQQNQLGRRVILRTKTSSLIPEGLNIRRGQVVKVACGAYHSFAIGKDGNVWGWGLNNYAETGIRENAGQNVGVIFEPTIIESLADHKIVDIAGGDHHSLAVDDRGTVLVWGRTDSSQVGLPRDQLNSENCMLDDRQVPRILLTPTPLACKYFLYLGPHIFIYGISSLCHILIAACSFSPFFLSLACLASKFSYIPRLLT